ncbi:hypothetical protein Hanom_Chr01g00024511 [Helianthus anomalus]
MNDELGCLFELDFIIFFPKLILKLFRFTVSLTKSHQPKQSSNSEEHDLRPEYQTISCELK